MKNSKAILQVPGTMKIISAEIPVPKEDEVLIKVEYVGICGSDVHGFESGPFIPPKDPNQEIGLGHECAGTVVAVGSRVSDYKVGDQVMAFGWNNNFADYFKIFSELCQTFVTNKRKKGH